MTSLSVDTDLFTEELRLEQLMTREGVERMARKTNKAKERGLEAETIYGSAIAKGHTDKIAKALDAFLKIATSGKPGRRHASARALKHLDSRVSAYLALRAVVNSLSSYPRLLTVVKAIGSAITDEVQYHSLREEDRQLYSRLQRSAEKRIGAHNKKTLVKTVASREGIDLPKFSLTEKIRVGEKMLEIIMAETGLVKIEMALDSSGTTSLKKTVNYLVPTPETLEWITKKLDNSALMAPNYQPMVVPPAPWEAPTGGGYLSSFVRPLSFVKVFNPAYMEELSHIDMPEVYAAVNRIQETAWTINTDLLDLMEELYEVNATWAPLPPSQEEEVPPQPNDIDTNEEARQAWRAEAARVHTRNRKTIGKRVSFNQARFTANRYADFEAIYFPYQVDFRGRVYAVPHFNPQGPDFMRALIHFADAIPLGEHGYKWFLVHGSNLVGVDKEECESRSKIGQQKRSYDLAVAE